MKLTPLLLLSLFICIPAFSQPEKITLWNGPAPDTQGRENTETIAANGNILQVFQPELTFYPAPTDGRITPAIIVCPGGGYKNIVIHKEGIRIAQWFNQHGFAVFVLKYRLDPKEAVQDLRRSVRVAREQAARLHIDPAKLGVVGFSAGGHLCANLAVNYAVSDAADTTDKISARPDFCAPIYGVLEALRRADFAPGRLNDAVFDLPAIKDGLTETTPPIFLAHAVDDKTVPVEHSLNLFIALKAKGVPVELHLYEKSGHGFALDSDRGYAASWGDSFLLWLKSHGIEAPAPAKP